MQKSGIGSVLKHFPGYGPNGDTHLGFVRDDRPMETFLKEDFLPFQAGIDAGAPSIFSQSQHRQLYGQLFAGVSLACCPSAAAGKFKV